MVEWTYQEIENPSQKNLEELEPIMVEIFSQWDPDWIFGTMEKHRHGHIVLCQDSKREIIGFKLGYAQSQKTFYSWLGGVGSGFRGQGIAKELARRQLDWCRRVGFKKISTKSMNQFRPMIVLNLKNGFDIIGTEVTEDSKIKIIFEKNIS